MIRTRAEKDREKIRKIALAAIGKRNLKEANKEERNHLAIDHLEHFEAELAKTALKRCLAQIKKDAKSGNECTVFDLGPEVSERELIKYRLMPRTPEERIKLNRWNCHIVDRLIKLLSEKGYVARNSSHNKEVTRGSDGILSWEWFTQITVVIV